MRTITVTEDCKKLLKNYPDENMTYDNIVNRLIHDVSDSMPALKIGSKRGGIHLHDDTVEKLREYELSDKETHEHIILRMLILADSLKE